MSVVSAGPDRGRRTLVQEYNRERRLGYNDAPSRILLNLIERGKEFDKRHSEPDCEDPVKAAYLKEILEHLKKIEERLTDIEQAQKLRQPHWVSIDLKAGQPLTVLTPIETREDEWRHWCASGYCPGCGGQWAEAPCTNKDHLAWHGYE